MRRILALLLLCAAPVAATDVYGLGDTVGAGYTARANGMDLDDDFVYGESGDVAGTDDDLACDDNTGTSGPIEEDVDNDGYAEPQIYVRPSVGTDNSQCGGPGISATGGACATVQYVIDNRMNTGTDHGGAVEDYICLYTGDGADANETLSIADEDGDAGTKTRTKVGLEQFDFQYPSNPNVLMGADWDQDGEYPPYDTDDEAIFDGNEAVDHDGFLVVSDGDGTEDTDRWEFAHFQARDYGIDAARNASDWYGFLKTGAADPTYILDHLYFHDIDNYGINYGQESLSGTMCFVNAWGYRYNYHAMENMRCLDCCGYVIRGSVGEADYWRFRNTTLTNYCEDTFGELCDQLGNCITSHPHGSGPKYWGLWNYGEWLYNDWDNDPTDYYINNAESCGGTGMAIVDNCQRDQYVLGNRFSNWGGAITLGGGLDRGCSQTTGFGVATRNADNLVAAYNEIVIDNGVCVDSNYIGFKFEASYDDPRNFLEDAIAHNNVIWDNSTAGDMGMCLYVNNGVPTGGAGDPSTSTFSFVGNTCHSDDWADGSGWRVLWIDIETDKPHNWVISSNIITGGTDTEILFSNDSALESLTSDYNVFYNSGNNSFVYNGQTYATLPLFAAASGTNANSKGEGQNNCDPTFVNYPDDLHLASGDTCAREAGTSMSAYYTVDYDQDARPQGVLWDIGADEQASGYNPEGACCDSACELTTDAACSLWEGAGTTCSPDPCESEPPLTPVGGFAEGVSFKGVSKE